MKTPTLAAGFVILSLMLPSKASAIQFNALYSFGDSLSDTGNVSNATGGLFPANPPPPQVSPYFQGSFSNGDLWVNYLADELGLNPTLFTTTQPGTIPSQGINFAFGGATSGIINSFAPNSPTPTGVLAQVAAFTQLLTVNNQRANPNALYTIWAGSNDYLFGNLNLTDPNVPLGVVNNVELAVRSLAGVGAENIVVLNLPDLGSSPFINRNPPFAGLFNNVTAAHNSNLQSSLTNLRQQLGINIVDVDVNRLFRTVTSNPGAFNFTNTSDSCITGSLGNVSDSIRAGLFNVCSNPDNFVFFDEVHPTTPTHRLVADTVLAAIQAESVPEPSAALGMVAFGALSAAGILKRQRRKSTLTSVIK
jgi:phospholipase/lecithinase/hemolysin